ncbi:MAG: shikimate kinase [Burkholderiales bacterium]|nr:shikimate kinase [Burkholderiales bacterium]
MRVSRNVYLVGLMGAGKTTVGRQLARRLGKTFIDSDHEIEARTGVRVATIFEIEGEPGFRAREARIIEELTALDNVVLATGGGVVLDPRNRERLALHGFVVYLRAQPRGLWQRMRHDRTRPLLQTDDPIGRLEELFHMRDPLYCEVADLVVDTGRQGPGALVTQVLAELPTECKLSA